MAESRSSGQQQLVIDLKASKRLWVGVRTKDAQVLLTQQSQSVQDVQVLFTKTQRHKDSFALIKDEKKIRSRSKGSKCL